MVLSDQVSNAEIKFCCETEDAQGDHLIDLSIIIKMNNPNGVPPPKNLFDSQIEPTGSNFDDTLPFLLKAVNSYIALFSMLSKVESVENYKDNFKVKETKYNFKFKVLRGDSRNLINMHIPNFQLASISPNENIYTWNPISKEKQPLKISADGIVVKEKMERISEKVIEKRINPELMSRPKTYTKRSMAKPDSISELPHRNSFNIPSHTSEHSISERKKQSYNQRGPETSNNSSTL